MLTLLRTVTNFYGRLDRIVVCKILGKYCVFTLDNEETVIAVRSVSWWLSWYLVRFVAGYLISWLSLQLTY